MDGEKKACVESGASHGAISKFEFVIDSATLCKVGRTDVVRFVRRRVKRQDSEGFFLAAMTRDFPLPCGKWDRQFDT